MKFKNKLMFFYTLNYFIVFFMFIYLIRLKLGYIGEPSIEREVLWVCISMAYGLIITRRFRKRIEKQEQQEEQNKQKN